MKNFMINRLLTYPGSLLMNISNSKFFSVITSSTWKSILTLVIIVAFFSFPSYDAAFGSQKMGKTWEFIFEQGKDPFTFHYSGYNSHTANLAFRFVPAILLNILHIDKLIPAFLFQFCTMVAFYLILMTLFKRLFDDTTKAFLYALGICFIIEGNVYCSDVRGMFDTLALDFLLGALLLRRSIFILLPLLLAYFTDERALIATPAILLLTAWENDDFKNIQLVFTSIFSKSNYYIFISWIAYFCIRFYMIHKFGLKAGHAEFPFFEQYNKIGYALYVGLEGFIIPFALVVFYLVKERVYVFTGLLVSSYLLVFYFAISVFDINRSMSYAILVLVLILVTFDKFHSKNTVYNILGWVLILNITFYDYCYPFLAQLYRMKFITHVF